MAPSSVLDNGKPLGLDAMQWIVVGFLGSAIAMFMYLAGKGESVPIPLVLICIAGVSYIGYGAYSNRGRATEKSAEEAAKFFIKQQERKERRLRKKIELELAKDAEKLEALQQKSIMVAKRRALNKAKAQAAALQKAAADAKKAAAEAEASLKVDAEGKKKKKKKKGKKNAVSQKATVVATSAAEPEPVEPEVWEEVESKKSKWAARKKQQDPLAFVETSQTDEEDYLEVNQKSYPVIIGTEGKTLARIQESTQCKVSLPKKGSGINVITLSGQPEAIEAAKTIINDLVSKGYSKALDSDMTDLKIKISNLGLLIGPNGANVRNIQTKTNTRIQLPPKGTEDGEVTIVGNSGDVVSAASAIKELMANGFCSLTHDNWTKSVVGFPASMIGILVGPKGENLNKMQSSTKTRINIPKVSKDDKTSILSVSVIGPEDGVEKAISQIKSIQTDFVSKEIEYPATMLVPLIGPKGENIRRIQSETNTRINIEEHLWDPTLRSITIEGFKDKIGLVEAELKTIIENNSHTEINFPVDRLGALIGKKGESIRKLQDESGVRISVKDHEWDDTVKVVIIEGLSKNVESTKVVVQGLAKAPKRLTKKSSKSDDEAEVEVVPVETD
jgi:rRNA processing protein Krr1/Pno1